MPDEPKTAELFKRKAHAPREPQMVLAYSGAEKERSIWYHGTTSDKLRSIMAHGLIPMEQSKRNWDADDDAGIHQPSRESYGGTYVTRNLSTATSAPRSRQGNNVLVVIMDLQPRTFIADEDDFGPRLNDPVGHLSDSSYHVPMIWLAANADPTTLGHGWAEDLTRYRTDYVARKLRFLDTHLGAKLDHPQLRERVEGLLEDAWMAGLTRLTAHHVTAMKDYDMVRQYQQVFPEAAQHLDDAQWEALKRKVKAMWPTVAEGEAAYRRVIDQLTRTLKATARPGVSQETFAPTARVMEPIGFRGSNRIIAVVEILPRKAGAAIHEYARVSQALFGVEDPKDLAPEQYQQVAQEVIRKQNEPETPVILHYGKLPQDFLDQWRERKGGVVEVQKAAALGSASEADIPVVIAKFLPHLSPGLPHPKVRVVNTLGTPWLARDLWVPGEDNTTIEIQKSVTGDRRTLERIIAHELVHHDIYLTVMLPYSAVGNLDQMLKIEGGHGANFKAKADRLNAVFGADFVTETSDSAMIEEEAGTPYYVLLKQNAPGQLSWAYCVRPSARQRAYIEERVVTGTAPGQFKLVKTRDRDWAQGPAVGKGFASTWDKGLNSKLQDLWERGEPLSKVAATAYDAEVAGVRTVRIELTPRLGYHYTIFARPVEDGFEAEMHRADGQDDLPPYKPHGHTVGEFTRACWAVLDEGYRNLIEAARRTGDKTRASQLYMEHRHEQQVLMADIEQAFRELPPGPRPDWSKPWEHAPKEGSVMAQMKRNTTKVQFAEKFRAMFPTWTVEVSGNELMALSPTNMDWPTLKATTEKLRDLSKAEGVVICSQPRSGHTLITIDLSGLL